MLEYEVPKLVPDKPVIVSPEEQQEFNDFYVRMYPSTITLFLRHLPRVPQADREDLAGLVWLKIWKAWPSRQKMGKDVAWHNTVVRRTVIDYVRHQNLYSVDLAYITEDTLPALHNIPASKDGEAPETREFLQRMAMKLAECTHQDIQAALKYLVEGHSLYETGKLLQTNPETIKSRYYRAITQIREDLQARGIHSLEEARLRFAV